ncbi:MAG TPA: hypothetical protein P5105_05325, partial [Victivallales bacterium]|nr:hypothetical protein [Victivallales bacterium]
MKQFHKIKIILAICIFALIFSAIFIFIYFSESIWPGKELILKNKGELLKMQSELQEKYKDMALKRRLRNNFIKETKSLWIEKRDGDLQQISQKIIENASKNAKITVNSLGNFSRSKVNEQCSYFDFSVEIKGSMEDLARFMIEIYKSKPTFYWTRCVIRYSKPDDSNELILSGALRVVSVDDPSIVSQIM